MTAQLLRWSAVRPLRWSVVRPLRWSVVRPLRRAAPARTSRTSRAARPPRRTYPDPFFADPAAVEDDSRRMMRPGPQP
jgi:hypothetical protein